MYRLCCQAVVLDEVAVEDFFLSFFLRPKRLPFNKLAYAW